MDSSSFEQVFHLDHDRRLLICKFCKYAINPTHRGVREHLFKIHKDVLSQETQSEIQKSIMEHEDISICWDGTKVNISDLFDAESLGYSPYLSVGPGYQCSVADCHYCCLQLTTMQKHQREKHTGMDILSEEQHEYPVQVSTFFKSPKHYFPVVVPLPLSQTENNSGSSRLTSIKAQYEKSLQDQQHNWAKVISSGDKGGQGLWMQRTQWIDHFQGLRMDSVAQSSALHCSSDPHNWKSFYQAIHDMIQKCNHAAETMHNPSTKQYLRSIGPDISSKPFHILDPSSLLTYIRMWQRLLGYLLRMHDHADEHRLTLSPSISAVAYQLQQTLRQNATSEELQTYCFDLSVELITQHILGNTWQSPLVHFVGVFAYNPTTHTWRSAKETQPCLSQLIHIMRLILLEFILPSTRLDTIPDPGQLMQQAMERYLWASSHSAFQTLHSLRLYAKTIGDDFYALPTIV